MSWLSRIIPSPVKNLFRAPDRIIHNILKGDVKKAASVVISPFSSRQETRDRNLRRATGVVSGAIPGFLTGGPVGAVVGGTIGGLKAGAGHGQLKDFATDAFVGAGAGGVAGAAAGALGFGQYGGVAGKLGSGLVGKFGGHGIAKTLTGGALSANSFVSGSGFPLPGGNNADNGVPKQPFTPRDFNFPDGTVIKGYSGTSEKKKVSWTGPALITVGALILTR